MPKGEIVGNMATAEMTHMIKVVIDGYRLFMENRLLQHKLQHKCEHRCYAKTENIEANADVKVVIDDNRLLWSTHSVRT
jgi:hypothetical protein